jgi:thiol-disulfide isomerase/thioredoxin
MRRGLGRWTVVALAAVALGIAIDAVVDHGHAEAVLKPAPPLPGRAIVGSAPTPAQVRGRPMVVAFGASWCHPCRQEAPELARLAAAAPYGVRVVAVAYEDPAADAARFARRYGWRFPVLADADGRAADRFGVIGVPTTFVVDRRGRIAAALQGPQTASGLTAVLRDHGVAS